MGSGLCPQSGLCCSELANNSAALCAEVAVLQDALLLPCGFETIDVLRESIDLVFDRAVGDDGTI